MHSLDTLMIEHDPATSLIAGLRFVFILGPLEIGGAERQALMLASGLRDTFGAHVEVWGTMGAPGRAAAHCDEHDVPWRIVPMGIRGLERNLRRAWQSIRRLFRFAKALRESRPDVVVSYMTMPNINAAFAWRYARARMCVWGQRDDGSTSSGWWVERLAARLAPVFIANSEHGAEFLASGLGVRRDRIEVIANGVRLHEAQVSRAMWRERLVVDDEAIVAVMLGNLHEGKDHPTLLRAWRKVVAELARENRTAVLALAGRFDSQHGALQRLAAELGIGDSVRFLGEVTDVAGLLAASDIGILSTYGEGLPNSVLEYMSASLPVVASDCPGVREAVGSTGAEMLSNVGDAEEMAGHILELARNEAERRVVGQRMKDRVDREFGPEQMIARTASVVARRLESRTPR